MKKDEKEKKILRIKLGALVRKNLTCYGVGGDPSIIVNDVSTLGLVCRLHSSTARFLVEFDNQMRLELRYKDFTYLTNTPEKQVLTRDMHGNMSLESTLDSFLDSDIQLIGVSDSPSRRNLSRRD
jgi:hypothetical protein